MEIFGLGIIGACMFIGSYIGRLLGTALGLDSDVGGVGFAMVLIVALCAYLEKKGTGLLKKTEGGIQFLSALYIPVVVAMSMNLNVYSAVTEGVIPIVAGVVATVGSLVLIPVLSKLAKDSGSETEYAGVNKE